jgi:hypothetical protein
VHDLEERINDRLCQVREVRVTVDMKSVVNHRRKPTIARSWRLRNRQVPADS